LWDKPCTKNEECPFYQANKSYKNYRGGCHDGYCEMPLGVERIAYKNYDPNRSKPWCYGCSSHPTTCCDITHDYAFPIDSYERIMSFK
jgi:hypothetical protein